jgi:hypothetical protein
MVAERINPETMRRIEEAVRELAEMEYPKVWVGKAGTTPDEALADELYNLAERKRAWEESRPEKREELWAQLPEDERGGYDHPRCRGTTCPITSSRISGASGSLPYPASRWRWKVKSPLLSKQPIFQ